MSVVPPKAVVKSGEWHLPQACTDCDTCCHGQAERRPKHTGYSFEIGAPCPLPPTRKRRYCSQPSSST